MKYLDAKKKLIFMLSAAKYIKLITGENKIKLDDEIFTNISNSIQLVFPDYTIKIEDINEIIGGIKSILMGAKETSKISDLTILEAKRRGDVNIDSKVFTNDLMEFQRAMAIKFNVDEKEVFSNTVVFNDIKSNYLQVDDLFKTFSAVEFNRTVSAIMEILENIGITDVIEIRDTNTNYLSIDSKFVLQDKIEVEMTDLIPIPFDITGISYMFESVNIGSASTKFIISNNKTELMDKVALSSDKASNLSLPVMLSFTDCLAISKYRYSLLEDYDDFDIDNIKNNFKMIDLIYIEQ